MKLLLDQNLSHRLIKRLEPHYPNSMHVSMLSMGNVSDRQIWTYAKKQGYIVVTLDADFYEYSLLWGGPPLIVWLKCGNKPKKDILSRLMDYREAIADADSDPSFWCVEIY